MIDALARQLLLLQGFVVFAVAAGLLTLVIGLISTRRLRLGKRRIAALGLLYGLNLRGRLRLSLCFLRLLFCVWCVAGSVTLVPVHYVLLAALFLLPALVSLRPMQLLSGVLGGVLTLAALTTGNLLLAYNREVRFEWSIAAVYWLLGLFIVLYCVYVFLKEAGQISSARRARDVSLEQA